MRNLLRWKVQRKVRNEGGKGKIINNNKKEKTEQGLRHLILLFHEVLRVVLVALRQHHLCQLLQLLARLHVIDQVHQKLNSVLVLHQLAIFIGVNLERRFMSFAPQGNIRSLTLVRLASAHTAQI